MLTKLERATKQWGGVNSTIDTWLDERKELLVQYCRLAGLPPFERPDKALPSSREINEFCEILMDYVSAGHFEIYEKIAADSDDMQEEQTRFPQFSPSTDAALSFNDKYANLADDCELRGFVVNLAALGQQMEERFSFEDQLIKALVHQA